MFEDGKKEYAVPNLPLETRRRKPSEKREPASPADPNAIVINDDMITVHHSGRGGKRYAAIFTDGLHREFS